MTIPVFPTLWAGVGYPVKRSILTSFDLETAISGKTAQFSLWSYPRYRFDFPINFMKNDPVWNIDWQTLEGFIKTVSMGNGIFQFNFAEDGSVTSAQTLGTGDGTTTTFQLLRTLGNFAEPVFALNGTPVVLLGGASIPAAGLSAPAAPTLSDQAGGALAATTYYVKVTWITASGESLPSSESNRAVAINRQLIVTAPASPPTGAIGWQVYVSNTAGGGSGAEKKQTNTVQTNGVNWTEPTSGLVNLGTPPAANTTGWSVTALGVLTFTGAPAVSTTVAWTGNFGWYCRFDDNQIDMSNDLSLYWSLKSLKFTTLKLP